MNLQIVKSKKIIGNTFLNSMQKYKKYLPSGIDVTY